MAVSLNDFTVLRGVIMFMPSNVGSKSEGIFPFLYVNHNQIIPIHFFKDNPFTNDSLREYDGKYVEIKGCGQGSRFTVKEISVIFCNENAEVSESTEKNFSAESEKNNEINKENNNTTGEEK